MYTIKIWVTDKTNSKIQCISRKVASIPEAIGHLQQAHDDGWKVLESHIYQ